ncbi:hypothetical protein Caci_7833 [Catenulispora acidiphila DSM 44928]|uniref:Peptidase A4 family protein n=1 Tax=Catenulispora acidiphila (strain DSM 44928 / JCM 14897 / NBRC 102108 / NRRL B-24433 / ID139908) TaxID=479433 RepID=C7QE69_CATAD|nr:G1 family glutamic endopeptidase [Catenulispora acidiphila]ACU76657.1 hypothetical protein Caci_7833 [Catenulispora acidiphila DSM 44928]
MSSSRRRTAAAVALAGAMTAALAATPASAGVVHRTPSAFRHDIRNSTSGNWAGYVATGGGFTSVSAGWTEPAVSCRSQNTYASFWIGLDGDGSNSVEQIGTESDCSGGHAVYSAWYEMYPGAPVDVAGPISPGDAMQASVSYGGSGHFTLVLADRTKGWTRTVQAQLNNPALASAEVIAEAPSDAAGVLPLSDFGTVGFTGASANGAALGSFAPDPITMANGGTTKAVPSGLSPSGDFTVAWRAS